MQVSTGGQWLPVPEAVEGLQCVLPFEFLILEIAFEVVCMHLDSKVADLETDAYPVLDELARTLSTKNLEPVRSLKSNLTHLLPRVQKARKYIDDTEGYVNNIQLNNQRNELIQLQLILTIPSFAMAVETLIAASFGMHIPCESYEVNGIFGYFVGGPLLQRAYCFSYSFLVTLDGRSCSGRES